MIIKVVSLEFAPASAQAGRELLTSSLGATRDFPGCEGVEVLEDLANPCRLHLVERWSNPEASAAYSEFRAGEGAMPELGGMLAGQPAALQGVVLG